MPDHSDDAYRALLDATRDGVLVTTGGRVTYVNAAILRLTGYTEDQLIDKPITDFGSRETRAKLLDRHRRRLAGEDLPQLYEIELLPAIGEAIPVEVSTHLTTWRGRPSVVSTLRDIRARRARQAADRALAERRIQHQRVDALGRIVGGVAHAFNNHLQGIMGYISLATDQLSANHPARADLATARRAAEQASDTVHQLLQVARPGPTGATPPQEIELDSLVRDFHPLLSALAGRTIQVDLHTRPAGRVRYDPTLVRQTLLHLALNARDAAPEGGGRIVISTHAIHFSNDDTPTWARPGHWSVLRVQDDGEGMTPEVHQRALDPYFSTRGLGRGLGLPAVLSAVQAAGGLLHIESTPSTGTTVQVLLPSTTSTPTLSPAPRTGTVAIVTQSALLRRLLVRLVESGGHRAVVCDTTAQARALTVPIDTAIVDHPPGQCGDVVEALGSPPQIHIIDPSTHTPEVPHLTRPIERRTLLDKLDELLQGD